MFVQPADSSMVPSSAAKLSTVRQEVVPTQITRPPVLPGLVDDPGGLPGDHAVLGVHLMVGDLLLLHRAEGPQPHMERHIAQPDPHLPPPGAAAPA